MSLRRLVLAIGALFCVGSALLGVEFSGATWTDTSQTPVAVSAAYDWTPPTVTVSDPGPSVMGSSVTITATASDSRSTVASVAIEFTLTGSSWTPLTACSSSGTSTVTYSCTWDTTTGVPDGSYQLRATAVDAAGNSGTSPLVSTAVTNNVSVVLTRLPAYVRGTVPVRGDLYNAVTPGTQLTLEYRPSGGAWRQLNGSCSSTSTPVQCSWNTNSQAVPDGTYDVRVTASTGQSDTQTGIVVDNTAPGIPTVTVPSGVLSGTISLSATVPPDSPAGIASTTLQYRLSPSGSWVDCGTSATSPVTCSLDTTILSNQAYDFRAVATDRAGNTSVSDPVTKTVDNRAATISFTQPANGASVDGTVTVSGAAQSPRGMTAIKVEYLAPSSSNYSSLCTPTPAATFSCSWNTASLPSGSYQLRATLSQTSGGDVTSTITVNVAHSNGTVVITSPVGGVTVGGTVTVAGTTSANGPVNQVRLKVTPLSPVGTATTLPCTLTSGGFTCAWNTQGLGYGSYQLVAEMTHSTNIVVTSSPVTVTVYNASITLGTVPANLRGTSANLTATASSNAGVTRVRFEGITPSGTIVPLCAATTPTSGATTYSCSWNISAITYGVYSVRAVMEQGPGFSDMPSAAATTTVDNRTLGGYDVWTVNGGIANLPDGGDQIFFRYTGMVKLSTIDARLTYGGSVPMSVSLTGDPGSHPDTMAFSNPNLGALTLTQRYLQNNKSVTYGASTMTAILAQDAQGNDVTIIKVTLSQISTTDFTAPTSVANTLTWTPSASVTAPFGNPCLATATPELGTADPDF